MIAVRLSDVAPDGRATRISYGLLNLTHRAGHDQPQALIPGERYRVAVTLNAMAQAIPPGHRLRLALSTSYWPLAWPPPQPVQLSIYPARSRLVLPLRPDAGRDELPVPSLGQFLTATAMDAVSSTSELSACVAVMGPPSPSTPVPLGWPVLVALGVLLAGAGAFLSRGR